MHENYDVRCYIISVDNYDVRCYIISVDNYDVRCYIISVDNFCGGVDTRPLELMQEQNTGIWRQSDEGNSKC